MGFVEIGNAVKLLMQSNKNTAAWLKSIYIYMTAATARLQLNAKAGPLRNVLQAMNNGLMTVKPCASS